MDIIKERQSLRTKKINKLTAYIGKLVDKGKEITKKQAIIWSMDRLEISKRTATEYVEVVLNRFKING